MRHLALRHACAACLAQLEGDWERARTIYDRGLTLSPAQLPLLCNRALLEKSALHPELKGMGTTVVLAIFRDERVFYAHVGDSRLYRVRYGRMRRLTHDHSLIQRMIDDGMFINRAAAREAGIRDNVLTRSLGMQRQAEVDVGSAVLEVGDTYLFCSDGLHGKVTDKELSRIVNEDQTKGVEKLIAMGCDVNSRDRINRTPMSLAPRPETHSTIFTLLREAGAHP